MTTHTVHTSAGLVTLEPMPLDRATVVSLHAWLTHPGAGYWGMRHLDRDEVGEVFANWDACPHRRVHLVRIDGMRVGLAVTYDPAEVELAGRYPHEPDDHGMHLLLAPTRTPVPGTSAAVMGAICETAFGALGARRLVVEPDLDNTAVHRLNARAGFVAHGPLALPDKTALFSSCTAEAYRVSEIGRRTHALPVRGAPEDGAHRHLTGHAMRRAHRHLCVKALAEFAHERLITPKALCDADDSPTYAVRAGRETWTFHARRLPLEHWVIDESSLRREVDGAPAEPDAQALVTALSPHLGITPGTAEIYLEEIAATLFSAAFCLHHRDRPAQDLAAAGLQEVEAAMTEGHPGFVANNARIGLGLMDRHRLTPEAPATVRLVWLAARRDLCHLATVPGLDEDAHYEAEFGRDGLDRCHATLRALGLDPADYRLLPVHPWQWEHQIAVAFAPDLAHRHLVYLGESSSEYRPQQSLRTFFDVSRPGRAYVKTALAVRNMDFTRGLSPKYMRDTPAVNAWVADLVASDTVLARLRFGVLQEVAAIGYTGDAYHRAADSGIAEEGPHTRMIAALWRESPVPGLAADERAVTLASLLHVDPHGRPLVVEHLERSGLAARTWLRTLLDVYLAPIARCLVAHGVVFMPHGENVILVLDEAHVPRRVLLKDIGEEVAVVRNRDLPADLARIRHVVDPETAALAVHTDVMDGVLRHLSGILDTAGALSASAFWDVARECLEDLAGDEVDSPAWAPLFAPEFRHSCLNRLQLRDARQMVDLTDQAASLQFAGTLPNPVAR